MQLNVIARQHPGIERTSTRCLPFTRRRTGQPRGCSNCCQQTHVQSQFMMVVVSLANTDTQDLRQTANQQESLGLVKSCFVSVRCQVNLSPG